MTQKIIDALRKLDSNNDAHWTSENLPRLETVRLFAGDNSLSRDAVTQAAPSFMRYGVLPDADSTQQAAQPAAQAAIEQQGQPSTGSTTPAAPAGDTQASVSNDDSNAGASNEQEDGIEGAGAAAGAAGDTPQPSSSVTEDELQQARARFEAAQRAAAKANQELSQATEALDEILDRQATTAGSQGLTEAIQAYHASQKQLMEQRGRQRQLLAQAGIRLSDLLPSRSKLDSALTRRTDRGTARPNFPGMGKTE